jgi:hypothetical protein
MPAYRVASGNAEKGTRKANTITIDGTMESRLKMVIDVAPG